MSLPPRLPEAEARRIYLDALDRAMRHAAVHVARDEAREVGHHVAAALVRRCAKESGEGDGVAPTGRVNAIDAFVHRAVLNRLRELWRAKRRRKKAEQLYQDERCSVAPAWTRPGSNLESRELHDAIAAAIAALPETRRQVFLLIRRDQRTYKEVASQLGIGVGTVHTHLSRANASLRQAVADFHAADHPLRIGRPRTIGRRT
jgi:RNA polymerase sigma factor (sigma-70 family)